MQTGYSRQYSGAAPASVDESLRLLAHELLDVVEATRGATRGARTLPAAEGLDAGPRTGRRAGSSVDVDDAGLDGLLERVDLFAILAEEAGGQTVDAVVS